MSMIDKKINITNYKTQYYTQLEKHTTTLRKLLDSKEKEAELKEELRQKEQEIAELKSAMEMEKPMKRKHLMETDSSLGSKRARLSKTGPILRASVKKPVVVYDDEVGFEDPKITEDVMKSVNDSVNEKVSDKDSDSIVENVSEKNNENVIEKVSEKASESKSNTIPEVVIESPPIFNPRFWKNQTMPHVFTERTFFKPVIRPTYSSESVKESFTFPATQVINKQPNSPQESEEFEHQDDSDYCF
jgi:hypothetical protein